MGIINSCCFEDKHPLPLIRALCDALSLPPAITEKLFTSGPLTTASEFFSLTELQIIDLGIPANLTADVVRVQQELQEEGWNELQELSPLAAQGLTMAKQPTKEHWREIIALTAASKNTNTSSTSASASSPHSTPNRRHHSPSSSSPRDFLEQLASIHVSTEATMIVWCTVLKRIANLGSKHQNWEQFLTPMLNCATLVRSDEGAIAWCLCLDWLAGWSTTRPKFATPQIHNACVHIANQIRSAECATVYCTALWNFVAYEVAARSVFGTAKMSAALCKVAEFVTGSVSSRYWVATCWYLLLDDAANSHFQNDEFKDAIEILVAPYVKNSYEKEKLEEVLAKIGVCGENDDDEQHEVNSDMNDKNEWVANQRKLLLEKRKQREQEEEKVKEQVTEQEHRERSVSNSNVVNANSAAAAAAGSSSSSSSSSSCSSTMMTRSELEVLRAADAAIKKQEELERQLKQQEDELEEIRKRQVSELEQQQQKASQSSSLEQEQKQKQEEQEKQQAQKKEDEEEEKERQKRLEAEQARLAQEQKKVEELEAKLLNINKQKAVYYSLLQQQQEEQEKQKQQAQQMSQPSTAVSSPSAVASASSAASSTPVVVTSPPAQQEIQLQQSQSQQQLLLQQILQALSTPQQQQQQQQQSQQQSATGLSPELLASLLGSVANNNNNNQQLQQTTPSRSLVLPQQQNVNPLALLAPAPAQTVPVQTQQTVQPQIQQQQTQQQQEIDAALEFL